MMFTPEACPVHHLPESIRELIDVVGLPAALLIVEERGGIRLCVPTTAKPDHWLARLIGLDALSALVAYYDGEEIEVPRCVAALRALKEHQINAAAQAGASNAQLAREFGYTERGIRKLRRRFKRQDDSQQDLF